MSPLLWDAVPMFQGMSGRTPGDPPLYSAVKVWRQLYLAEAGRGGTTCGGGNCAGLTGSIDQVGTNGSPGW